MQTELFSLSKVFAENLFRIPDYQRGYSWRERQLTEFWNDVLQLEPNRDHYTGVLTLEEVSPTDFERWPDDLWIIASKRYKPYYVVDGQQRLTTALILLQCILERAGATAELNYTPVEEIRKKYIFESRDKGLSRSYIFGYEKDNPSYNFLKTHIFLESTDDHDVGEETIYTHNLLNAKEYFAEQLGEMNLAAVEAVYTKLTQHMLFNLYIMSGDVDVFVAFETMNNRGKRLSHLELLKNRLIFLSTRLDLDDIERQKLRRVVNDSWKTVYHFLGRNQKRPLDDDHFLTVESFLYLSVHAPPDAKAVVVARRIRYADDVEGHGSYLLDRYFTTRNLAVAPDAIHPLSAKVLFEYAHSLKRTVDTYYRLMNPADSDWSDQARISLEQIWRLGWRDGLPLAIAAVQRGASDATLELLFGRLERHLFLQMMRFNYGGDEQLDLTEVAVRLVRGQESVDDVSAKVHDSTERGVKKLDLADVSLSWARSRGYYGWRGLAYVMFEYEQELASRSRSSRDKLVWEEFVREDYAKDYSTIEHIYPQKPRDPYWTERFNHLSVKQRNMVRNSLGNLLALSRAKNSALSNRPFHEKRDGAIDFPGYREGSYSEIEVAREPEWTPLAILERGIKIMEFLGDRWALPVGDRKKMIAILRLGFLSGEVETSDDHEESVDSE